MAAAFLCQDTHSLILTVNLLPQDGGNSQADDFCSSAEDTHQAGPQEGLVKATGMVLLVTAATTKPRPRLLDFYYY